MTTEHNPLNLQGNPTTNKEWLLSEEVEDLFIADAQKVCIEQSNRRYRIKREDVIRLIQNYGDIPISRILAILNFESEIWRNV